MFLFAGTALFLLTSPSKRHWMLSPWPYLGVAIAAVMFLPVIVWNIEHDWVSFAFQGGRARMTRLDLMGPLRVLAGQALYFLPWLWVPLAISLVRAAMQGPNDERAWLAVCLAIGPILAFTLVAVSGNRVLYHWAAPGYLFGFALLGRDLAGIPQQSRKRARIWLTSTAASLIVILVAVLALARLPWPPVAWANPPTYPLIETVSWSELKSDLLAPRSARAPQHVRPCHPLARSRPHRRCARRSDAGALSVQRRARLCRDLSQRRECRPRRPDRGRAAHQGAS